MEETEEQAALLESIELGMLENVTKLLDGGLDPNFVLNGRNPVCVASEVGYDDVLTVLLAHGGNPNHQDSGGLGQRQPIHLACCAGHVNCVRVLLQAGVDVNIRDGEQRTPLHWAATYGCVTVVEFLIESGCMVNTSQTDGFTPLHAATCLGYDKPCRVLVENGADVNAADDDGWAAIHSAACYGHRDLISYFLQNGADIDQRTEKQETPLHIAASCGHVGIVQALLRLGADIDCKNSFGYTPFHVAVLQNKYETAEVLASVNAEVNTASRTGCSPFFLAAIRAQENFMRLILGMGFDVRSEKWLINDNHYPNALKARPDLCEWLSIFCTNPRTLKQNCVLCVRKLIGKHTLTKVHFLEIPEMLKDYITLPFV